jgi:hypothetical protein
MLSSDDFIERAARDFDCFQLLVQRVMGEIESRAAAASNERRATWAVTASAAPVLSPARRPKLTLIFNPGTPSQ